MPPGKRKGSRKSRGSRKRQRRIHRLTNDERRRRNRDIRQLAENEFERLHPDDPFTKNELDDRVLAAVSQELPAVDGSEERKQDSKSVKCGTKLIIDTKIRNRGLLKISRATYRKLLIPETQTSHVKFRFGKTPSNQTVETNDSYKIGDRPLKYLQLTDTESYYHLLLLVIFLRFEIADVIRAFIIFFALDLDRMLRVLELILTRLNELKGTIPLPPDTEHHCRYKSCPHVELVTKWALDQMSPTFRRRRWKNMITKKCPENESSPETDMIFLATRLRQEGSLLPLSHQAETYWQVPPTGALNDMSIKVVQFQGHETNPNNVLKMTYSLVNPLPVIDMDQESPEVREIVGHLERLFSDASIACSTRAVASYIAAFEQQFLNSLTTWLDVATGVGFLNKTTQAR